MEKDSCASYSTDPIGLWLGFGNLSPHTAGLDIRPDKLVALGEPGGFLKGPSPMRAIGIHAIEPLSMHE